MGILNKISEKFINPILQNQEDQKFLLGQYVSIEMKNKYHSIVNLRDAEFKVFSQWGDDGIIQFIISKIDDLNKFFVEFGVENYKESNTRFLLMNNNWSGMVMDSNPGNIDFIRKDSIYWKYQLHAKTAFVTAENINDLLVQENIRGGIGLLHIDIDGNDYWIWQALDVVTPTIIIVEYNSIFGRQRSITIPYNPKFNRFEAHFSGLYFGASLRAFNDLAHKKGYFFLGCNSAGNNAYFVLNAYRNSFKEVSLEEGFVLSKFRESRSLNKTLTYISEENRIKEIAGMPVVNTKSGAIEQL